MNVPIADQVIPDWRAARIASITQRSALERAWIASRSKATAFGSSSSESDGS